MKSGRSNDYGRTEIRQLITANEFRNLDFPSLDRYNHSGLLCAEQEIFQKISDLDQSKDLAHRYSYYLLTIVFQKGEVGAMAEGNEQTVFRKKTLDRISSPEQLTDYLRVSNPGIWVVLVAVILLLAGIFAWSAVGTLETTADASVIVQEHKAEIVTTGSEELSSGMTVRAAGQEFLIGSVETDPYGRMIGTAEVELPNGTFEGKVVIERIHPIEFLLTSR